MASTSSSWNDHRDHAVVPWISLSGSATAADIGGASPSSRHSNNNHDGSVTCKIPDDGSEHYLQQQQPCSTYTSQHQSCKILSLLSTRERIGIRSMAAAGGASVSRTGWLYEGRNVSTTSLAMSGAWNKRRMQNMTLAIGPGSPASNMFASNILSDAALLNNMGEGSSSSSSSSFSEHPSLEEEEGSGGGDDDVDLLHLSSGDDDENGGGSDDNEEDNDDCSSKEENVTEMAEEEVDGGLQEGEVAALAAEEEKEEDSNFDETEMVDEEDLELLNEEECRDHVRADPQHGASRDAWTRRDDDDNESNSSGSDDDHDDDDMDEGAEGRGWNLSRLDRLEQYVEHIERAQRRRRRRRRRQMMDSASSPSRSSANNVNASTTTDDNKNIMQHREVGRSIKHGGCINTACWLDVDWRISTVSHEDSGNDYYKGAFITSSSFSSNSEYYNPPSSPSRRRADYGKFATPTSPSEVPTQICTSGDDHLIKFWDVAASMGSISPLSGGSATVTPFSSPAEPMRASKCNSF